MPSSRAAAPTSLARAASSVGGVRRHHRQAQPRAARRARSAGGSPGRRRRAPAPPRRSPSRSSALADDHAGRSGSAPAATSNPSAASAARSVDGVGLQLARPACGRSIQQLERRASAAATAGGGSAVEKMNVARGVDEIARRSSGRRRRTRRRSRAPCRACRRSRRPRPRARPRRPRRARPGRAPRSRGPHRPPAAHPWRRASSTMLLERRDVAVHREHAVGHDQRAAAARPARMPQAQVLEVAVVVDEVSARDEPAAVDDRGVVELLGEDDSPGRAERRDARRCSRDSRSRTGAPPRCPRTPPAAPRAGGGSSSCPDTSREAPAPTPQRIAASAAAWRTARMVGEAEVVVGAQQQHRRAVEQHARPLRAADRAGSAVKARGRGALRAARRYRRSRRLGRGPSLAFVERVAQLRRGSHSARSARPRGRVAASIDIGASRPRASRSGCRGGGWRRCRAGGRRSALAPRTSARSSLGRVAERGQEVAHHHAVQPGPAPPSPAARRGSRRVRRRDGTAPRAGSGGRSRPT